MPCHSWQQHSSYTEQTRTLNVVFGPLLLGPFLTCCHLSQLQLPQSPRPLQTAWFCTPAKQERATRGSPGAKRGCPRHQLPIGFLLLNSGKLPSYHALQTDTTDTAGSALHHVQGLIWLQLPFLLSLAASPHLVWCRELFLHLSSSPTLSVPKYTSNYNNANKGTSIEASFLYSKYQAAKQNWKALQ